MFFYFVHQLVIPRSQFLFKVVKSGTIVSETKEAVPGHTTR